MRLYIHGDAEPFEVQVVTENLSEVEAKARVGGELVTDRLTLGIGDFAVRMTGTEVDKLIACGYDVTDGRATDNTSDIN